MTIPVGDFLEEVDDLIDADDDLLSAGARRRRVSGALYKYSVDRPDDAIAEVAGDAGKYYPIASNLVGWTEGLSQIQSIEYPAAVVASDETPQYLEPEDYDDSFWAKLSTVSTRYLFLPTHAPAATETMRITYTLAYTFDDTTGGTDVPPADFYAVCYWAAGLCCQALAAKFAKAKDSIFDVDSATHGPKSESFAARAVEFFALYNNHLGIDTGPGAAGAANEAAGEFVDWDTMPGWPGSREFIFRNSGIR
jgi:hypothetical protein